MGKKSSPTRHTQDAGGHRAAGVKTSSEKYNTRSSVPSARPEPHSAARHHDAHHSHSEPHYRCSSQCLATDTWSVVTRKKPRSLHKARVSSVLLALKITNLCGLVQNTKVSIQVYPKRNETVATLKEKKEREKNPNHFEFV